MASHRKHIEKAQHNEKLLASQMLDTAYPDWYITVSFYAAVHWMRAYLALQGCCSGDMDDLHYDQFQTELRGIGQRAVRADPKSKLLEEAEKVIREFKDLKSLSRNTRYRCSTLQSYARNTHDADTGLKNVRKFVTSQGVRP